MWISARTATTLAAAALLLVMVAVAAPLLPRPHLPSLPEERALAKTVASGDKFGAATAVLQAPERVRAQRMSKCDPATAAEGGARLVATGRYGNGPAVEPSQDTVKRLLALLKDARTVADPRAAEAEATWVVRLVRGDKKVDVMVDPANDRAVLTVNGEPVGSYGIAALHHEFTLLGNSLFSAERS
ncbi:hypothetical protein EON82_19375 [bacterium]|nr:MAG: hypothetical protein EON82_19375 [bacterium]